MSNATGSGDAVESGLAGCEVHARRSIKPPTTRSQMPNSLFRRPQSHPLRKFLFQIHLWAGLIFGVWVVVIGVTGAALVFRPEMQAATFSRFFDIRREDPTDAPSDVIIAQLRALYPDAALAGIDYPTYRRDSYLAYLTQDGKLLTVFSHPVTGEILGELPQTSWIAQLQSLHFDLLAGPTGRTVNGIAALALVLMFTTGLAVWWPGLLRWRRSLWVDFRSGWKRANWDMHGATGFWLFGLLMLWAVTGVEFAFPDQFRAAVNAVSPLTVIPTPSSVPQSEVLAAAGTSAIAARSRQLVPGAILARIVLPFGDAAPLQVIMARERHGDFDTSDEVHLYFDQYTGELREQRVPALQAASAGDRFLKWLGPVHVGSFGGLRVRILWFFLALSFPLLAVTGTLMWWNRVVRRGTSPATGGPAQNN